MRTAETLTPAFIPSQLIEAIEAAKIAAHRADKSPAGGAHEPGTTHIDWDGGTCNFDSPFVDLSEYPKKKISGFLSQISEKTGVKLDPVYNQRFYKGCYFVRIRLNGQAMNRTRMAEAAADAITSAGMKGSVYYHAD